MCGGGTRRAIKVSAISLRGPFAIAAARLRGFTFFATTRARPGWRTILSLTAARSGSGAGFPMLATSLRGLTFFTATFALLGFFTRLTLRELFAGKHIHIARRQQGGKLPARVTVPSGRASTVKGWGAVGLGRAHFLGEWGRTLG